MKIWECEECGTIIAVMTSGVPGLICCGEDTTDWQPCHDMKLVPAVEHEALVAACKRKDELSAELERLKSVEQPSCANCVKSHINDSGAIDCMFECEVINDMGVTEKDLIKVHINAAAELMQEAGNSIGKDNGKARHNVFIALRVLYKHVLPKLEEK